MKVMCKWQVCDLTHLGWNWDYLDFIGGQSYKDFYTLGKIYKPVLKHATMPCNKFLFVIMLGHYDLTY